MKDAYYFPHDCNARNDQKLIAVRAQYGMRGYGIYFGIIEMLREANGYQISSKINLLAFDLREDENIIKDIVENYDLFTIEGGLIFSESLLQRMGHLSEVREKRRLAGKLGGLANAKVLLKQKSSKSVAVKESKVKESIVLQKSQNSPTKQFIDHWYQRYLAKFNKPYFVQGGKDGSLVKKIVEAFGLDTAKILAEKFFDSEDSFIKNSGYTIGVFNSQINKLHNLIDIDDISIPSGMPFGYKDPVEVK